MTKILPQPLSRNTMGILAALLLALLAMHAFSLRGFGEAGSGGPECFEGNGSSGYTTVTTGLNRGVKRFHFTSMTQEVWVNFGAPAKTAVIVLQEKGSEEYLVREIQSFYTPSQEWNAFDMLRLAFEKGDTEIPQALARFSKIVHYEGNWPNQPAIQKVDRKKAFDMLGWNGECTQAGKES